MLKRISVMASSYFMVMSWLVRDITRTLRLRIAWLFGLTLAVILSKVVTFGGFLLFLHSYIGDAPMTIPRIGISLSPQPMIWAPAILVAGITMGALGYLEARMRVQLAADYAADAMRRTLLTFSEPDFEKRYPQDLPHKYKMYLLAGGSMALMRAAMMSIGCLLPIIQLAASATILLTMSWQLTTSIVILGILYIIPFYYINRHMMSASRRRTATNMQFRSGVQKALSAVAFPQYRHATRHSAQEAMFVNGRVMEMFGLFLSVRTARDAVTFLSSVFLALFMFAVIIYMAEVSSRTGLIGFAAYAVVLFHSYASANTIARQVAVLNRFFPEVRSYAEILSLQGQATLAPERFPIIRTAKGGILPQGSRKTLTLQPGDFCGVVQPRRLTFRNRENWLANLGLAASANIHPFFVPSLSEVPDLPLRKIVEGGPSDSSNEPNSPVLQIPAVADFLSTLPKGLDTGWAQAGASMPDEIAFSLMMSSAASIDCNAVVAPASTFGSMAVGLREALMAAVPGKVWLLDVSAGAVVESIPADETPVVLATEDGVIGIGDRCWAAEAIRADPGLFRHRAEKEVPDTFMDDEELDDGTA